MKRAIYGLSNTATKYNLKISVNKIKAMTMKGKIYFGNKMAINNHILKQVTNFKYLRRTITVKNNRYLEIKMNRINRM
jgi:hypothetical protein